MAAAFVCASFTACGSGSKESRLEGNEVYELYKDNPDDEMEYCRLKDCTFKLLNEKN